MEFSIKNTGFVLVGLMVALIACFIWYWHGAPRGIIKTPFTISMKKLSDYEDLMPVVVIGSGPASLSAALYTARSFMPTLVIAGNKPGGALTETSYIENWPGREKIFGSELMEDLKKQAKKFGAEFMNDAVSSVDFSAWPFVIKTEGNKTIHALSVIIGTGSTPKTLKVPGEQEYWGKGVTTCAICDAPFHRNHDVVVVGGGDSAAEEAMQLAPYAKTVTLLVRKGEMRASAVMKERLQEYPNIKILYFKEIKAINGDGNEVTSIDLYDNQTKKTTQMPVQGVFLAIGHDPNSVLFSPYIKTDAQGYIITLPYSQRTNLAGVFAAGDVQDNHYKQAGVAAGDGIRAGLDAVAFLQDHGFNTQVAQEIEPRLFQPLANEMLTLEHIQTNEEFDQVVKQARNKLVVLDFYTMYCPSCLQMLPALSSVAYELADQIVCFKIDLGKKNDLGERFKVTAVPTLLVFEQGNLVSRHNQAMSRKQLMTYFGRFLHKE